MNITGNCFSVSYAIIIHNSDTEAGIEKSFKKISK